MRRGQESKDEEHKEDPTYREERFRVVTFFGATAEGTGGASAA
jgi:hypothetical protein